MKLLRLFSFLVLAFVISLSAPGYLLANSSYHSSSDIPEMITVKTPVDGGIKEEIPAKYQIRFDRWKAEFLATDFGREQWEKYANNKQFLLTIAITSKKGKGAGTDKYLWDEAGNFVGATITLGDELNEGYPNPIYYPVMNSLSANETSYSISGRILAAAKISHEFGHVNQTANANRVFMQLQNSLMPVYTSIFLKNGRDTRDKKLVELAKQMGGTPVEIWESREYWSEVNALRYLNERISKEDYHCFVFNKIKQNIETYAKEYEDRFDKQTEFSNSPCWK
ncbi:MAG: hypothetical protein ABL999_11050 [Pyrinomonadaceae bacterium]